MQRRNKLTRSGRCILSCPPAGNVGQCELETRNGLGDRQVAGMTDSATIAMGRPIVVMDLLGDGGGGLKTGEEGQQKQYEDCSCKPPPRDIGATH